MLLALQLTGSRRKMAGAPLSGEPKVIGSHLCGGPTYPLWDLLGAAPSFVDPDVHPQHGHIIILGSKVSTLHSAVF